MDWVSFVISVVAGGLAGVFIARTRFWKAKYHEEKQRWEMENDINLTQIKSMARSLEEYRDAYNEMTKVRGVTGTQTIGSGQWDEEVFQKLLANLGAPQSQHVIQEEP